MLGAVDQPRAPIMQAGAGTIGALMLLIPDEARREIDAAQQFLVARLAHPFQDQAVGIGEQQQIMRWRDLTEQPAHFGPDDLRQWTELCTPLFHDAIFDTLAWRVAA